MHSDMFSGIDYSDNAGPTDCKSISLAESQAGCCAAATWIDCNNCSGNVDGPAQLTYLPLSGRLSPMRRVDLLILATRANV
jgi:hypothetical protein